MNLINNSKFGNCTRCPEKDTECRKRGKDLVCLHCCKIEDTQKQVTKANLRNRVRGLRGHQVEAGNEDAASRSALIQDIDFYFSRYLRIRDMDEYSNCKCFICGTVKNFGLMQAMHFVSRSCIGLRFFEKNVRVGCQNCNVHLNGNLDQYSQKLNEEEGNLAEWLKEQGRVVSKPSMDDLRGLLAEYKQKLKSVEYKLKK